MIQIITNPENIFYLTGFKGSFGIVIINDQKIFLATDNRYFSDLKGNLKSSEIAPVCYDHDFAEKFGQNFTGPAQVEMSITLKKLESLEQNFPNAELHPTPSLVEYQRRSKTPEEIEKTKVAQNHVDKILVPFLERTLKPGITEQEVAFELEHLIRNKGQFGLAFDAIVAFGPNSAIPHHHPGQTKLQNNQNILIDCGAKFEGYHSDMTRNFWFGDQIDSEYKSKFDTLLAAQISALTQYNVGEEVADIDNFCRKMLGSDQKYFTHSLGHGVGLQIHESPGVSQYSNEVLIDGDIVTCEPGLYFPGKFGIRIEDLLVIGKGQNQILSQTPKELIQIQNKSNHESLCTSP